MDTEFNRAKEYVYRLLALRPRTEKEIALKMKQKGFAQEVIQDVTGLLKEYGYIDDTGFAQLWVRSRCHLKPMGKRRLFQELYLKGVEKGAIETALTRLTPELEYSMAMKIVERKMAKRHIEPRKVFSFLLRRGFSADVVNKILRELNEEYMPE